MYVDSIAPIYDFVSMLENEKPSFVSSKNNATFASLLSEYNTIKLSMDMFNNYVLVNNVWKDKASAMDSLNETKTRLTNELSTLTTYVDALKEQIANIKPQENKVVSPTGGETITTTYPDLYYEYQNKLNSAQLQIKAMNDQLNNIEMRLNKIDDTETETPEEIITAATAMLLKIEDQASAYVNKVNATIADYYDTTIIASSVRQVRPATVTRMESSLNLVVVLVVAFVVGLFVGGITTGVKMSNAKLKAKQTSVAVDYRKKADADKAKAEPKKE